MLGSLAQLSSLSFDWFRSSESTVAIHQAPVFRVYVSNGSTVEELIWEYIYQPYYTSAGAPVDQWITTDLLGNNQNFYRNATRNECNYNCGNATNNFGLAAGNWNVVGISVGAGSGWGNNKFIGYTDNVAIGFGNNAPTVYNFETTMPAVVPEPSTYLLMASGLAGLGLIARRRRA